MSRVVLLFCHGSGLHKGVWTPIIRRLQAAGIDCEFVAIDWRYHGENACDDEPATLFYESNNVRHPRVAHPASHWPQWAADHVRETVAELKRDDPRLHRTTHVIGIGHSIGAATLLSVEAVTPGTLAGLVLFEPTVSFEAKVFGGMRMTSLLIGLTMMREDTWNSMEEAVKYIKTAPVYRRWHPETIDAFIEGALKCAPDGKTVRLATPLLQEAALYCHEITDIKRHQLANAGCRIVVEYGSHTVLLNVFAMLDMAESVPEKVTLDEPLQKLSHMSILEDPDLCAQRVLKALNTFPAFQCTRTKASRL